MKNSEGRLSRFDMKRIDSKKSLRHVSGANSVENLIVRWITITSKCPDCSRIVINGPVAKTDDILQF